MRPIGGVVLGHLGDRLGRGFVLVFSIVLMGLATAAIGVLPNYETIGVGAPLLLLFLRMLQGFSVGGEFTGSVSYLVETAPQHRRGFAGSFANFGSTAGMLLAAAVAATTVTLTSTGQLQSWAWRVPFLLGVIIAAGGYFLRSRLRESGYKPSAARANDSVATEAGDHIGAAGHGLCGGVHLRLRHRQLPDYGVSACLCERVWNCA